MWIVPRSPGDTTPPQQIGYLNVVPACIDAGGVFSSPKFASYGETLNQLNQMLKTQPLQGGWPLKYVVKTSFIMDGRFEYLIINSFWRLIYNYPYKANSNQVGVFNA